ncbi:MAG TPA: PAS domain S-box protein, partial [Geobacteraceae bacterium]
MPLSHALKGFPAKITLVYAAVGVLWILLSDRLLHALVADQTQFARLSTIKGWVFIVVSAAVLYRLASRDYAELLRSRESVREQEERMRTVLETLPVGVWLLDAAGNISYGNPAGKRVWGGARFVGMGEFGDYKGWWLGTDRRIEAGEWGGARAIRNGETSLDEEIEIEGLDGVRRIILHSAVPLRNAHQEVVGAIVVNQEITDKKRMEETIRASETAYRTLFDDNPQPMWVYDLETLAFLAVNTAAVEHYGYSREEFLAMTIADIHPPEVVPQLRQAVSGHPGVLRKVGVWPQTKKDGTLVNVEITTHDTMFSGRAAGLVLARDVTESLKAERDIVAYQEELRFLASEISLVEERERRRLATVLHDEIGQTLALARIKLGVLRAAGSAEERKREADEIERLLGQAIKVSRSVTFDLSPPILYELGFEAAVQSLCERFGDEHRIGIEFATDAEPKPLGDDARAFLFQSVRELLVNIIKHARASTARVSSRREHDTIVVT